MEDGPLELSTLLIRLVGHGRLEDGPDGSDALQKKKQISDEDACKGRLGGTDLGSKHENVIFHAGLFGQDGVDDLRDDLNDLEFGSSPAATKQCQLLELGRE